MSRGFITRASLKPGAAASILMRAAAHDRGHALLWTLFQHRPKGERCFLYRSEKNSNGQFLIVSTQLPEDREGLWQLDSKPYEPELSVNDALRFVLRVNPAVTWRDGEKTVRTDVVMKAKSALKNAAARNEIDKGAILSDWLQSRLADRGAALTESVLVGWTVRPHRARTGRHNLAVADLEGTLTVTDPDGFGRTLFDGLGKARAYGCGLLLVRRA